MRDDTTALTDIHLTMTAPADLSRDTHDGRFLTKQTQKMTNWERVQQKGALGRLNIHGC
jgi:hypothetical protein